MASVMMAKLELVTVNVRLTSLVHHVRSVFQQNMAEIAQITVNVSMACVMKAFMEMADVIASMVGKDSFATPLPITPTAFQLTVVDMPHVVAQAVVEGVNATLVTQEMERTAQKSTHVL